MNAILRTTKISASVACIRRKHAHYSTSLCENNLTRQFQLTLFPLYSTKQRIQRPSVKNTSLRELDHCKETQWTSSHSQVSIHSNTDPPQKKVSSCYLRTLTICCSQHLVKERIDKVRHIWKHGQCAVVISISFALKDVLLLSERVNDLMAIAKSAVLR